MPYSSVNLHEKTCSLCKSSSSTISAKLGVCKQCLLNNFEKAMKIINANRKKYRELYNLPAFPPKSTNGISCGDCVNNCIIAEGELGFCGLVTNKNGKKERITGDEKTGGLFSFYHDPLPTNCVAEPFCPGCTSSGYPKYSYSDGPEFGYNNLAVFYQSCTYDCLFCQNYQYRKGIHLATPSPPETLLKAIKDNTSCICFFGGDPSSQIRHSIAVGNLALEKAKKENRILRVCWETNGSTRPSLLLQTAEIALKSGGSIKIDLKAYDNRLVQALCGSSNKFSLYNIRKIGSLINKRPETPLLVVSTLLVPGYIEKEQIEQIAKFITTINPSIPFSLLAFYPTFILDDLPTTAKTHAEDCYKIAKEMGLQNVWIGNKHLLR